MATAKNKTNNKVGKDMKKREHSNAIGGNVNWWSHWAKQYRGLLKNNIQLPYNSAIPLLGISICKKQKH